MTPGPTQMPGSSTDVLTSAFSAAAPRLRRLACHLLGSSWDADDALQETWLRLRRSNFGAIENLDGWLTTVTSRVCLDLVRRRQARHEDLDLELNDAAVAPEQDRLLDEASIEMALGLVLDRLGPLERLALVLHDLFGLPYDQIALIVGKPASTARQLASRARRKVRTIDADAATLSARDAVEAFLAAARNGDFGALLQMLDPEVQLRADPAAVALAAPHAGDGAPLLQPRVGGSDAVARVFAGRAQLTAAAAVNGRIGAAYAPDQQVAALYELRWSNGRIVAIDVVADSRALSIAVALLG